MAELLIIVGLGVACALWAWLQRASGRELHVCEGAGARCAKGDEKSGGQARCGDCPNARVESGAASGVRSGGTPGHD